MLFQIATGWEDIECVDQRDIIYYISSLSLIKEHKRAYFFTDGHARSQTSRLFNRDADLDKLDWAAITARNETGKVMNLAYKGRKRSKPSYL